MMIWYLIWYLFRIYLFLMRFIGLLNLGFDSKRVVFQTNRKLTIIYCVLVNVLCILFLPGALKIKIHDLEKHVKSVKETILLVLTNFISLFNIVGLLITLSNAWIQRSRLCGLLNKYARLLRKYRAELFSYEIRAVRAETLRLLIAKWFTSCSRFILFYICNYGQFKEPPPMNMVFSSLLFCTLEALMIYADINIFLFLLSTNMLLGVLLQQLRNIRRDVSLMYLLECKPSAARPGCRQRHIVWRLQLCSELRVLLKLQRHLQHLLKNMLQVYQWQLLVALLCSFYNHIVMLYNFFLYIKESEHFHMSFFLFYMLIVGANIWNLQQLFDACELLMQRHREMRQQLECMLMQFAHIDGGSCPKGAELKLQRRIELFLMELQQHGMRLRICGLFDLNHGAGYQMHHAIVSYLIVLVQITLTSL